MENNEEIREKLKKYNITYSDLLKYLTNFSHTTRISEELALPLKPERKQIYLDAIEKIRQEKIKIYES
jgi:exopolyphosphatase/pppGpp-phosphohydrolase